MKIFRFLSLILLLGFALGCVSGNQNPPPQPAPTEMLPTIVAQTLAAQGIGIETPSPIEPQPQVETPTSTLAVTTAAPPSSSPTSTATDEAAASPENSPTATTTLPDNTAEPPPTETLVEGDESPPPTATEPLVIAVNPFPATHTPAPYVPEARVQIYWLGERSLVTSPIQVHARLTSQVGKTIRIDLYGEDGRLLTRHLKTLYNIPWHVAGLDIELPFEISATAEAGRLVISVEDVFGRIIDINSVNLVLLSVGKTELNPTNALYQRIVIQEPSDKALIQGGHIIVSGVAQPDGDLPLRVALIAEDGRVLGQRLAGVNAPTPGAYGSFSVEVSYTVTEATNALVVVYEEGGVMSDISHLASVEVLLSP